MIRKEVIDVCLGILDDVRNESFTLYEALDEYSADKLTFSEAEMVCSALDYYLSGARTFWKSGNKGDFTPEEEGNDTTPYDLVNAIREADINAKREKAIEEFNNAVIKLTEFGYDVKATVTEVGTIPIK